MKIPVYKPVLIGNEAKYVNECLATSWISSKGEFIGRFEEAFARYIGSSYATSVSNGTVALHLALHTLGIKAGDEVIVPTFTYIASVNAIAMVGATPVFVDSDASTWNIDVNEIEKKITKNTKAVLAVHLYGAVCDMTALGDICTKHRLLLIEDVAEAFGSQYKHKFAGSFGDVATFSFFGNKTITTGEGGMIVSKNAITATRVAYLKSQAVSPTREYWHDEVGFNYRMTNVCAAIGLAQLEYADKTITSKRQLASWYKSELNNCDLTFQEEPQDTLHTFWMVSVLAKDKATRDRIRKKLSEAGVETRPLFTPAHIMPAFRQQQSYPVAEALSERGLNLPSYPELSKEQVGYISAIIKNVV